MLTTIKKRERERREKIESNTRKTKLLSDFVYLFVFTWVVYLLVCVCVWGIETN